MPRHRCHPIFIHTFFLTFHPEPLQLGLHDRALEPHAGRQQQHHADEEDGPGVGLDEATEFEELLLELGSQPESLSATRGLALEKI